MLTERYKGGRGGTAVDWGTQGYVHGDHTILIIHLVGNSSRNTVDSCAVFFIDDISGRCAEEILGGSGGIWWAKERHEIRDVHVFWHWDRRRIDQV